MKNKILIAVLIIFLIIGGLYLVYLIDEQPSETIFSSNESVTLTVASEGPYDVSKLCEDIKTHPYYKGYDNETLKWLESYRDYQCLSSSDAYVVIDKGEIGKIPILNANDVFVNETFECEIVENRSLGHNLKDILIVKNIDYKNETIKSMLE